MPTIGECMKTYELFQSITEQLQKAGCDSPAFDACCLFEDIGGFPRGRRLASDDSTVDETTADAICKAAARRADGEPLQYILGEWEFLDLTLKVGGGVLIPRPDTELLCETAAAHLRSYSEPAVLDLCAGSGCVGLGVWSLCRGASVTAVELHDAALGYLRDNAARYQEAHLTVLQDDILAPKLTYGTFDAILSNPPYIPTADLPALMREVQHEPKTALDGDADGLRFYRAIAADWTAHLNRGGLLAVEVGIGQAADVAALFEESGLQNVRVFRDLGGVERVVCGERQ